MKMETHDFIVAGCDVGSTSGKAVILKGNRIAASAIIPCEIDPEETARRVLSLAAAQIGWDNGIEAFDYLVGTGYGRNEIPFADDNFSEISCHALGSFFCDPEIKTIIDIGGQDVKGVAIDETGGVAEFVMNDKCAAGTGRFLEMMSRIFKMELEGFSDLSLKSTVPLPISSQCSVFAETEVISLLNKRQSPADVAAGIHASVAKRALSLLKKVGVRPKVSITGGCSKNRALVQAIEKKLRMEIVPLPIDAQLMGALGAAVTAMRSVSGGALKKSA